MGQYYYIVNLTKKQYLHPHVFDDGLKLLEFASSRCRTLSALALLLADGNGRGGGDFGRTEAISEHPLVGSWAGDSIVIAGDYADEGKFTPDPKTNLFSYAQETFENISLQVRTLMRESGEF